VRRASEDVGRAGRGRSRLSPSSAGVARDGKRTTIAASPRAETADAPGRRARGRMLRARRRRPRARQRRPPRSAPPSGRRRRRRCGAAGRGGQPAGGERDTRVSRLERAMGADSPPRRLSKDRKASPAATTGVPGRRARSSRPRTKALDKPYPTDERSAGCPLLLASQRAACRERLLRARLRWPRHTLQATVRRTLARAGSEVTPSGARPKQTDMVAAGRESATGCATRKIAHVRETPPFSGVITRKLRG
jgi:hypothetical protein